MFRRTLLVSLLVLPLAARADCGCGPKGNPNFMAAKLYQRALLAENREEKIDLLRQVLTLEPHHEGALAMLAELGVDPAT